MRSLAAIALLTMAALARARAADLEIVRDGQPCAEIVVAEQAVPSARLAATELQEYLEKISGARLPIVAQPTGGATAALLVGRSAETDRLKLSDEGLPDGAFRMVSGEHFLALLGHDTATRPCEPYARSHGDLARVQVEWDRLTGQQWGFPFALVYKQFNRELGLWESDEHGSLNAVHELLRSLGVRWYLPSPLGEIVPSRRTIALAPVDRLVRPDFPLRWFSQTGQHYGLTSREEVMWQLRLGVDKAPELVGEVGLGHGIVPLHSRPEVMAAHPELYLLRNGQRDTVNHGGGSPCLSSPELFAQNVKYVRYLFDHTDVPMVSVMPQDGYTALCECPLCQGKGTPERGFEGNISDYVWGYVERVAEEVYKTHPQKRIVCFAYGAYALPPEKIAQLSPNIMVGITQGRARFDDPEPREKMEALRAAWRAKLAPGAPPFFIWDYYLQARPGSATFGLPVFFPHAIARDLQSLKGRSIGDFIEVHRELPGLVSLAVNHLNLYLTARMQWDTTQDVDALLEEYYTLFYGPAAGPMKAFIEYSEANWPAMTKSAAEIDRALSLLETARTAVPDGSIYAQRIALLTDYTKPMQELRRQLSSTRAETRQLRVIGLRNQEVKIDGALDEPFWSSLIAHALLDPERKKPPATNKTTVKVTTRGQSVLFGIRCEEEDLAGLAKPLAERDDPALLRGDHLELLIETTLHSYYQVGVDPSGQVYDADLERGVEARWSAGAQVATHRGDGYWSAEIELPLAPELQATVDPLNGLLGRLPTRTYPWYFNVIRQRVRTGKSELTVFAPPQEKGGDVRAKASFGALITPK